MADGYYNNTCCCGEDICCALKCFIGQTVTIFTKSGGATGCGFTGVLVSVDDCFVRIITRVGGAPTCPIGSTCCGPNEGCNGYYNGWGYSGEYGGKDCCGPYNQLGSICVIPINSIASFTHNAI